MIKETASVPTTNAAPERDFAVLDRLMREKPNASQITLESMILFSNNKSYSWLEHKHVRKEKNSLKLLARLLQPCDRSSKQEGKSYF